MCSVRHKRMDLYRAMGPISQEFYLPPAQKNAAKITRFRRSDHQLDRPARDIT